MTKKQQPEGQEALAADRYEILCWGACAEGSPCSIHYMVGDQEKIAVTGDVVDDLPAAGIGVPGQEEFRSLILGVHIQKVEAV